LTNGLSIQRFPRKQRLAGKSFAEVFSDAKAFRAAGLVLLIRASEQQKPRLGIVVGKKYIKPAWLRNQYKRQVRESFRYWQKDLPALDIVVLVREQQGQHNKAEFRQKLQQQWQKIIKFYTDRA
jgi:ribonuclease P protein component